MSRHFNLPHGWKWSQDFTWDMSMADQLLKMGWTIKNHDYKDLNDSKDS